MNRSDYKLRRMFGKKPDLAAVLIWATQQALKGYGTTHPEMKRQRSRKQRDLRLWGERQRKEIYRRP